MGWVVFRLVGRCLFGGFAALGLLQSSPCGSGLLCRGDDPLLGGIGVLVREVPS